MLNINRQRTTLILQILYKRRFFQYFNSYPDITILLTTPFGVYFPLIYFQINKTAFIEAFLVLDIRDRNIPPGLSN
ncbi:hypothetical protein JZ00_17070 [Pseudomonas frederiksbergensis]|uniref:Uncharacterized protein n=1 Tax=Pseudomonas frederiksbergensis TaxID=104087 RepID=A0A0B1Z2M6_9PSED|nr:hypothetical protein JZ00_17070 [Pseudomonas frederiksbergensis]